MSESRFHYTGHAPYLDRAAVALNLDATIAAVAKQQPALASFNSAVVQAVDAPPTARGEILLHARKFRDGLAMALHAADAILRDVHRELKVPEPAMRGEGLGVRGEAEQEQEQEEVEPPDLDASVAKAPGRTPEEAGVIKPSIHGDPIPAPAPLSSRLPAPAPRPSEEPKLGRPGRKS